MVDRSKTGDMGRGPGIGGSQSSSDYWEARYSNGGNSGAGSYGELAAYKAKVLNDFVLEKRIRTVIEWGCGDGSQLALAHYPAYLGIDVSRTSVELCTAKFADDNTKGFFWYSPHHFVDRPGFLVADVALSLDVIFHLVEDETYHRYMKNLFGSATKHVVIYSSFGSEPPCEAAHVRHREFCRWVEENQPEWRLTSALANPYSPFDPARPAETTFARFAFFEKGAD